jgi:hypothetical protein
MTEVLGYERFAAQGGDWGAFITSRLGMSTPTSSSASTSTLLACAVTRRWSKPDA